MDVSKWTVWRYVVFGVEQGMTIFGGSKIGAEINRAEHFQTRLSLVHHRIKVRVYLEDSPYDHPASRRRCRYEARLLFFFDKRRVC
jgi:hypothetical protein